MKQGLFIGYLWLVYQRVGMGGPYNPLNPCKHISISTLAIYCFPLILKVIFIHRTVKNKSLGLEQRK